MRAIELQTPDSIDESFEAQLDDFSPSLRSVAQEARTFLSQFKSRVSQNDIEYLRQCFSKTNCGYVDYDRFGETFAYTYFFKNFWKAAGTFSKEQPQLARRVIDAGTGSGATILAYLASLNETVGENKWKIEVILIDRSSVQLDLVSSLLRDASRQLTNLDIVPKFLNIDLRDWQPEENGADSILFGHVLTENRNDVNCFLQKAFSSISENGKVYIIERKDDNIWSTIQDHSSQLALPSCSGLVKLQIKSPTLINEKDFIIKTRYLALHMPERKNVVELLQRYFDAWRTKSVSSLDSVFSPNAEYFDKPYQPPFKGIDGVRQYWEEHVLNQNEIELRILRVAYTGSDAFAEWEATFLRAEMRVCIRGALILKVDAALSRAVTLHEYYQSIKSPY